MKKHLIYKTFSAGLSLSFFVYSQDPRHLSTAKPILGESQEAVMQSPLQFVSPSIRAFESPAFSIPQEQPANSLDLVPETKTYISHKHVGRAPVSPIQAPLEFISPSIRAYSFVSALAQEHKKSPFSYE